MDQPTKRGTILGIPNVVMERGIKGGDFSKSPVELTTQAVDRPYELTPSEAQSFYKVLKRRAVQQGGSGKLVDSTSLRTKTRLEQSHGRSMEDSTD